MTSPLSRAAALVYLAMPSEGFTTSLQMVAATDLTRVEAQRGLAELKRRGLIRGVAEGHQPVKFELVGK